MKEENKAKIHFKMISTIQSNRAEEETQVIAQTEEENREGQEKDLTLIIGGQRINQGETQIGNQAKKSCKIQTHHSKEVIKRHKKLDQFP